MIRRTFDATFLNSVANDPDVRPHIGGEGPIDLTEIAANPANILIEAERMGGWVLQCLLPGVYELHTLWLRAFRGRAYFECAEEALRYVFAHTDALEIVTKVPDDNRVAGFAATKIGFRERFWRANARNGDVGVSFRVLTVDDWTFRDAVCEAEGHAFHEALEAAKAEAGSVLSAHPDDPAHDQMVGATALMIKGGQTAKGASLFNRWCVFAGYANIAAITPTVIDVVDGVVEWRDGAMQVLSVRGRPQQE